MSKTSQKVMKKRKKIQRKKILNSVNTQKPPENGRFKCDAKNMHFDDLIRNLNNDSEIFRTLASGTICRVQCNRSYSIPYHLYPLSKIECTNGVWNVTDVEFCYKKVPQIHNHNFHHHKHNLH